MTKDMRRDPRALSNEEELFTLIAEFVSSSAQRESLMVRINFLLQSGFDWIYFLRLADNHNYLPTVYRFFRDYEIYDDLQDHVKSTLENEYLLSQARFAKKESELMEILGAFEAQGLDAVVFKGIPQAYLLYNDPGIRVSKDIDILVNPDQLEAARQVLFDSGFTLHTGLLSEKDYREYHFHLIFTRGESLDLVVELHWTLLDPKKGHTMDTETVLRQSVTMGMQSRDVKTLSLPHTLWYMCMHLSYKAFLDARGLAELKRLAVKMNESEWDCVIKWAVETGTFDQLKLALAVSESLFGKFLEKINSQRLKPSAFMNMFILSTFYPRGLVWDWVPFLPTHDIIVLLSLRPGIKMKIKYLYNIISPGRKTVLEVYPGRINETVKLKSRYIESFYVFLKVIILTFLLGPLISHKMVGLDPVKHGADS